MANDEQTFLFADLAGYTALTEAHGDEESAQLTNDFFDAVRALLPAHHAEEIKTIGDAVMIRVPSAAEAVRLGVDIVEDIGTGHGFPSVRIGMHTGPASERDGDWFGAAVNTAARVSGVAGGCEVLLTEGTREHAHDLGEVELSRRGATELKNVQEPVHLYAAARAGALAGSLPIDPVCRMAVDRERAAAQMMHAGVEYHFCSLRCAEAFAAAPERYAGEGSSRGGPDLAAATALVQGASYIGFGIWSLAGRRHYRDVHEIDRDDWVLNAHGGWLLAVGTTLVASALRGRANGAEVRTLGVASALALALNDAVSLPRVAPIYRSDLAYEVGLAGLWGFRAISRSTMPHLRRVALSISKPSISR